MTVEREDELNSESFLDKSKLLSVTKSGQVRGMTVLNSELFVVPYLLSKVNVYNTNNCIRTRRITIINTGSYSLFAIVASPRYNALYANI